MNFGIHVTSPSIYHIIYFDKSGNLSEHGFYCTPSIEAKRVGDTVMGDIEQIQDLRILRTLKSKYGISPKRKINLEDEISKNITTAPVHLSNRLKGLEKEDEFLLILYLLADVEQITRLEQKKVFNKKKYTIPDFLIAVPIPKFLKKSEYPISNRMFIEVKKCKKESKEFLITKIAYKKLKNYSSLYEPIQILFAVMIDMPMIKQWFLISGKALEKYGKTERRRVNNRGQYCYVMDIAELAKYDLSGLWMNNYQCLLRKDTKITKIYDSSIEKSKFTDKRYGALVSYKLEIGDKEFEIKINESELIEAMPYSFLQEILSQGNIKRTKSGSITTVQYICDEHYLIPYYRILLDCYLNIRKQFRKILNETDDSPGFYINTFGDLDRNIVNAIKNSYFNLMDSGFITPIRMLPNFNKEDEKD